MELSVIFSDDRGEFLEHYGVPGMKWGVRKARPTSGRLHNKLAILHSRKLRKAAKSSSLDAENLKKAGYLEEARAVKKVSDKQMAKAKAIEAKQYKKPSSSKKETSVKKNLRPAQLRAKRAGQQLALGTGYSLLGGLTAAGAMKVTGGNIPATMLANTAVALTAGTAAAKSNYRSSYKYKTQLSQAYAQKGDQKRAKKYQQQAKGVEETYKLFYNSDIKEDINKKK